MRQIDTIVVHCSYTKPHMNWGASDIRRIHVDENGWRDIGYHVVIRRDGVMEGGRPYEEAGAHAKGYNATSIGICLIGGMDEHGDPDSNFTAAQYKTLATITDSLVKAFEVTKIVGHYELDKTKECPCFDVRAFMAEGVIDG